MDNKFNSIDEILEDIKNGKIVVMIDDEDRENEGDGSESGRSDFRNTPDINTVNYIVEKT